MAISTGIFDGVNLAQLPAPQLVETFAPETLRVAVIADFVALYPEFNALTPADPAIKELELLAYRELLLRHRVNEAGLSRMLAFATGGDLDHIAAHYFLTRKTIVAADPATNAPAVLESDDDLRARVQRAPEGWSVAGPVGGYISRAMQADDDVRFASAISPEPCEIVVTVQSYSGGGVPSAALIAAVNAFLSEEDARPLGDRLTVQAAAPVDYTINAALYLYDGPDTALVLSAATAALALYRAKNERLGNDITLSGVMAALHVAGVQRVELSGFVPLIIGPHQFARATALNIVFGGRDD